MQVEFWKVKSEAQPRKICSETVMTTILLPQQSEPIYNVTVMHAPLSTMLARGGQHSAHIRLLQ